MPIVFKPYQLEAIKLLKQKKKSFLTNACNTGKTLISLQFAKELGGRTLIVCENKKILDWKEEAKKLNFTNYEIYNYANIYKCFRRHDFAIFLLDECQNMGDWNSTKGKTNITLAQRAPYVVFISATPTLSKPIGLYWPLKICKAFSGTKEEFRIRYCGAFRIPGKIWLIDGKWTNTQELRNKLTSVEVNTAKSVRKLTIKNHIINCSLNIDKYKLNSKFKKVLNTPEFEQTSINRLAIGIAKMEVYKAWVRTNTLPSKMVFFHHHKYVGQELQRLYDCPRISGQTSVKKAKQIIEEFSAQSRGYLVLSLKSCAAGINIFNCNKCFFIEQDFSPMLIKQAIQRLAREKRVATIYAYFLRAKNEHTDIVLNKKHEGFKKLKF